MLGKDIVIVAHSTEDQKNDETIDRIDIIGGSRNEINKNADMMGRVGFDASGNRVLSFSPYIYFAW